MLHAQYLDVAGLSWMSRQDDTSRAYMFFGDRMPAAALDVTGAPRSLMAGGLPVAPLLVLAVHLGVDIVT